MDANTRMLLHTMNQLVIPRVAKSNSPIHLEVFYLWCALHAICLNLSFIVLSHMKAVLNGEFCELPDGMVITLIAKHLRVELSAFENEEAVGLSDFNSIVRTFMNEQGWVNDVSYDQCCFDSESTTFLKEVDTLEFFDDDNDVKPIAPSDMSLNSIFEELGRVLEFSEQDVYGNRIHIDKEEVVKDLKAFISLTMDESVKDIKDFFHKKTMFATLLAFPTTTPVPPTTATSTTPTDPPAPPSA